MKNKIRCEEFKKELFNFLLKEGLTFQYFQNLSKHAWDMSNPTIEGVVDHRQKQDVSDKFIYGSFINYSFEWENTPETGDMWSIVDAKFTEYIEQTEFYNKYF